MCKGVEVTLIMLKLDCPDTVIIVDLVISMAKLRCVRPLSK